MAQQGKRYPMSRILAVLSPFTTNKNTGNLYEIATALTLLRQMGVGNEELDANKELLEAIAAHNGKKTDELRGLFETIKKKDVGTNLCFDGKSIARIECITQDDDAGRTGDLLLHTTDGEALSLSICEGKPKRGGGGITKCLTNPSAKRFGCTTEDCVRFDAIQQKAVIHYKAYMSTKYGDAESAWPSRIKTDIATEACASVARAVQERFASFPAARQKEIIQDLLRIEDGKKPADYLALVDKQTLMPRFYRFDIPPATPWEPRLVAKGINLIVENAGKPIGSIQVKFNNGIYHKGKTSGIHSSWNATFQLSDLFTMRAIA